MRKITILLTSILVTSCSLNRPSIQEINEYKGNSSFEEVGDNKLSKFVFIKPYGGYGPPRGDTHKFNLTSNTDEMLSVSVQQGDYVEFHLCPGNYGIDYMFYSGSLQIGQAKALDSMKAKAGTTSYFLFWGEFIKISKEEANWWLHKLKTDDTFDSFTGNKELPVNC